MKKLWIISAVAAMIVGCTQKHGVTYRGLLPAADGPGIEVTLTLDAGVRDGDTLFVLDEVYIEAGTMGENLHYVTKGKQHRISRIVDGVCRHAYMLTPERHEPPMYWLIIDDQTLRFVNDSLQMSRSGILYDLRRVP